MTLNKFNSLKKTKEHVVKCCNGYLRLNLLLLHDLRKQSNGILQPLCKNVVLGGTEHNVKLCPKYHATCDTSHVGRIGKLKLTMNFPRLGCTQYSASTESSMSSPTVSLLMSSLFSYLTKRWKIKDDLHDM